MKGRGNIDLNGKKSKLLSCGCCEAFNHKEKHLKIEHQKLMREAKLGG